jgi:hypothetical protein
MSRIAFVMGSNGPSWSTPLHFAERDEDRIAECFSLHCGFNVLRPQKQADIYDVMRQLNKLAASCRQGDEFVVYYSGHGELLGGNLFLLWNNTSESIFDSALDAKHILAALSHCQASQKLLILDCCRAGAAVGFKSTNRLQPLLDDVVSQLVLCASSRLELAREFDEFEGSFIAHGISSFLASRRRTLVSLTDLMSELNRLADAHNEQSPDKRVPKPYLFGEQKLPFILKRPVGDQPVQVQFRSLFEPDMELLKGTLAQYSRWNPGFIFNSLPVEVTLPSEFLDRAATLQHYLDTDSWPTVVEQQTKDQVHELVSKGLPDFRDDLVRAIRVMAAAAIQPDGSILEAARNTVLEAYIGAKTFATFRVLRAIWLKNESYAPWMPQFNHLDDVWSNRLIYGLTCLSQYRFPWTFWTDADWRINGNRFRVYIPQMVGKGKDDLHHLGQQDYWWHMLPQILEDKGCEVYLSNFFPQFVELKFHEAWPELIVRGELFIETESHNYPDARHAKLRATKMVARSIVEDLKAIDPSEWREAFFRLFPFSGILDNLHESILDIMPELRREDQLALRVWAKELERE